MSKTGYEVFRTWEASRLKGFLETLFRKPPRKHYIVKIVNDKLPDEEWLAVVEALRPKIERYRLDRSIVFVPDQYRPGELPDWLPAAPTEAEAADLIDFEEIERELGLEGQEE
ncbi:MAG: hypothetical protein GXO27_04385 [Chlorobi bacterium]|nr:hypothetical protein [Chlorobiota bacterium]